MLFAEVQGNRIAKSEAGVLILQLSLPNKSFDLKKFQEAGNSAVYTLPHPVESLRRSPCQVIVYSLSASYFCFMRVFMVFTLSDYVFIFYCCFPYCYVIPLQS